MASWALNITSLPQGYVFFEAGLGYTTDAEGKGGFNAAAIGFRYDFSWKTPHVE